MGSILTVLLPIGFILFILFLPDISDCIPESVIKVIQIIEDLAEISSK